MKSPLYIAFAVPCLLTLACWRVCGISLGFFLAGPFLLAPILPPLVLTQRSTLRSILIAGYAVCAVAVVWLIGLSRPEVSFTQWLASCMLLIAFAGLVSGVAIALARAKVDPATVSAITVVLSIIWLTAPVWLFSNHPALLSIHPVFAINGVFPNLGTWTHLPLAYRQLTTLGQDVPYTLPTRIWACVLAHLIPGIALWWVGSQRAEAAGHSAASPSAAAAQS